MNLENIKNRFIKTFIIDNYADDMAKVEFCTHDYFFTKENTYISKTIILDPNYCWLCGKLEKDFNKIKQWNN